METGNKRKSVHRPTAVPSTEYVAANFSRQIPPSAKYKITKQTHFLFCTKSCASMVCRTATQFPDKKRTHLNPFKTHFYRSFWRQKSWFRQQSGELCGDRKWTGAGRLSRQTVTNSPKIVTDKLRIGAKNKPLHKMLSAQKPL
jgi:hypothetical protein